MAYKHAEKNSTGGTKEMSDEEKPRAKSDHRRKKKEDLIEFLRLMPAYATHDKELLEKRLKLLHYKLKTSGNVRDPLLYAKLQNAQEETQDEDPPSLTD